MKSCQPNRSSVGTAIRPIQHARWASGIPNPLVCVRTNLSGWPAAGGATGRGRTGQFSGRARAPGSAPFSCPPGPRPFPPRRRIRRPLEKKGALGHPRSARARATPTMVSRIRQALLRNRGEEVEKELSNRQGVGVPRNNFVLPSGLDLPVPRLSRCPDVQVSPGLDETAISGRGGRGRKPRSTAIDGWQNRLQNKHLRIVSPAGQKFCVAGQDRCGGGAGSVRIAAIAVGRRWPAAAGLGARLAPGRSGGVQLKSRYSRRAKTTIAASTVIANTATSTRAACCAVTGTNHAALGPGMPS